MIEKFDMTNCGPIEKTSWEPGSGFNVVIGENGTGKTLLLKTLYVAARSMEEFGKGEDTRTFRQVLDHKLTWTFQLKKIGDLVRKGEGNKLRFEAVIDTRKLFFTFGQSAEIRSWRIESITKMMPLNMGW